MHDTILYASTLQASFETKSSSVSSKVSHHIHLSLELALRIMVMHPRLCYILLMHGGGVDKSARGSQERPSMPSTRGESLSSRNQISCILNLSAVTVCHPRYSPICQNGWHPLILLLACLQRNSFKEEKCQGEIGELYECCRLYYEREGDHSHTMSCPRASLLRLKMEQRIKAA